MGHGGARWYGLGTACHDNNIKFHIILNALFLSFAETETKKPILHSISELFDRISHKFAFRINKNGVLQD